MLLNTDYRNVESNARSKAFSIQASGKMFKMIISGLYSDKPQSITREIWSNAFDAHVMAGNADKPFDVTFPTRMNPEFVCRDYGTGLSHDFMVNEYTVLGHSEKEGTNLAVGKWGVGRMSPLSYTDTFTVQSYHKGKVGYYSVTVGRSGEPELSVMQEPVYTDEPDGLRIAFPVNTCDLNSFQSAASRVAAGFDVQPNAINVTDGLPQIEKVLTGKGFFTYRHSSLTGPIVKMGCVLYPVNRTILPDNTLRYLDIVVDVPIGSCEVTASREDLSYGPDDPTEATIKEAFGNVGEHLALEAQKVIDKCDTSYKAYVCWLDAIRTLPMLRGHTFTYKGNKLEHIAKHPYNNQGLEVSSVSREGKKGFGWSSKDGLHLDAKNKADGIKIFVEHTGKGKDVRVVQRVKEMVGRFETFLWIKADLDKDQAKVEAFAKQFGELAKLTYVRDLEDTGPTQRTTKREVKVKRWNPSKDYYYDTVLSSEEFDNGGVYVETINNTVVKPGQVSVGNNTLLCFLMSLEDRLQSIIRVPKTLVKKFQDHPKWVEAHSLLKPTYEKHKELITQQAFRYCLFKSSRTELHTLGNNVHLHYTNDVTKFLAAAIKEGAVAKIAQGYASAVLNQYDLTTAKALEDKAADFLEAIRKKYPLLEHCSLYSSSSHKAVADYMKLVDTSTMTTA